VHFEARCTRLDRAGRCAIHGRHPVLCREYDPRTCERRLPLTDLRAWFSDGDELEEWLRRERPRHYRRLMEFRRDQPAGPPVADAHAVPALVTIGAPGGDARERRADRPARRRA